jgi:molecular chaperone HtpG
MPSGQDSIYFLPGDSEEAVLKSPLLKKFLKKNVEVLLLTDPIDEFCMQHLAEYDKYKLKSISKEDGGLLETDSSAKKKFSKVKDMYKPLTEWFKTRLGKNVEKVAVSNRLVDDPAYIFTS